MDLSPNNHPTKDTPGPDIENSFFRSWALRTRNSNYSSASDISPGTRTPATTPVSPKGQVRPRRQERPSHESRFSDTHPHYFHNGSNRRDLASDIEPLSPPALEVAAQDQTPTQDRASRGSVTSRASSTASSITRRALSVVKGPTKRPSNPLARKPTRPARGGFAWRREVSGHWLEIRVRKKTDLVAKSPDTDAPEIPPAPYPSPVVGIQTNQHASKIRKPSNKKSTLGQPLPSSTDSSSFEEKPKESIVTRAKRVLSSKSAIVLPSPKIRRSRAESKTEEVLNRASNALREHADNRKLTPPSDSTSSNLSIAGRPKQRRLLFRPGYRRKATGGSSSSSIRRVMFGKPPVGTPDEDAMYSGSDAQQYFRVEITDPGAPTYLPSEARRIGTPPLSGQGSKLRGFFFDYKAPRSASEQGGSPWPNAPVNTAPLPHRQRDLTLPRDRPAMAPRSPGARLQRSDEDVNWFRVKVVAQEAEDDRHRFELNVPEHLPSSPLCPRNPKHKSGGKGVCVYHGRNKTGPDDVEDVGMGWR